MTKHPIEDQAQIVWAAASKGRFLARAGFRSVAYSIMERLDAVAQNSTCRSLSKIARDAAVDIDNILSSRQPMASSFNRPFNK